MSGEVISAIRTELKQAADAEKKSGYEHYFKEKITCYGVGTAEVRQIARKYFPAVKSRGKNEILALCEELLKSDYNEEAFIACEWSYRLRREYEESDFTRFENWLQNYINNWAKCDTLCNHTVGALVDRYPRLVSHLKRWTKSENRWLRRAAAVTLILPAKEGKFLTDIFEIADSLLTDKEDLVQKGYGWLLKEASKKHQFEVLAYVLKNKPAMPRTALRYSIEKMPAELRRLAMAKS
jgi:3-methyladenine DNA glycosylase AlkD